MEHRSIYTSSSSNNRPSRTTSYNQSSSRRSSYQSSSSGRRGSYDDDFFDEDDYFEDRPKRSTATRSGRTSIKDSRSSLSNRNYSKSGNKRSSGKSSSKGNLSKYSTYNKKVSLGRDYDSHRSSVESRRPEYLDDRGGKKVDVYSYKSKPTTGHVAARNMPLPKDKRRDARKKRKVVSYVYIVIAALLLVGSVPFNKIVFDKVMESDIDVQVIPEAILDVIPLSFL